jgi:periplasmic copper chaperone A
MLRSSALALTLALVAAAPAFAAGVRVEGAWSRPAVAGATGAGFMTLIGGDREDALVAVQSPFARKAEVHRTEMQSGVMRMQKLDRLTVPKGARVTLAPGGHHLMFIGLSKAVKSGDVVPATLIFASGAKVQAQFKVGLSAPVAGHAH